MRNMLALLGLLVVVFVGAGWYLGWYRVESQPSGDGTQQLQVNIDSKKIGRDVSQGLKKGGELLQELSEGPPESQDQKTDAQSQSNEGNWFRGPPPASLPGPVPRQVSTSESSTSNWWYPPNRQPLPPASLPVHLRSGH